MRLLRRKRLKPPTEQELINSMIDIVLGIALMPIVEKITRELIYGHPTCLTGYLLRDVGLEPLTIEEIFSET